MRLHRFIGDYDLTSDHLKIKDSDLTNQVRNVLRLKKGDEIILADGNLNEARTKVSEISKDVVEVDIVEKWHNQNESESDVVLYCAILKRENFELVVQKATEIGAKKIVPIITERTVKLDIRPDRLQKIIREAGEQSGRGKLPILSDTVEFSDAIGTLSGNGLNLFFDKSGESFTTISRQDNVSRTGIWIGPEGGWTDQEVESARSAGFKILNLGKLTLRAETAAITASFAVVNKF